MSGYGEYALPAFFSKYQQIALSDLINLYLHQRSKKVLNAPLSQ